MGDENFHGFPGNSLLFFKRESLESPHVVKPVSQFYEYYPNIFGHRQKYFSEIFKLDFLFIPPEFEFSKLCDAVNEIGNFRDRIFYGYLRG